jgi:SAM-dependent methyltransferase
MLPLLYHAHHSLHPEDLPFWQQLAAQHAGPILELGCGTGRVTLPLLQQGAAIIGLDADHAMLTCLAQLAAGSAPPIFQADMSAFHLAQRFGLVLLPCNTFSTLSAAQRQATAACVRQHLRQDGLFVVSIPNPALLAQLPRRSAMEWEDVFPHPADGEPVEVSSGWQRSEQAITFTWHYDHLLPDGRSERASVQATHTLQPADTYAAEMTAAGLQIVAQYGDYDHSPHESDSPYLILFSTLT